MSNWIKDWYKGSEEQAAYNERAAEAKAQDKEIKERHRKPQRMSSYAKRILNQKDTVRFNSALDGIYVDVSKKLDEMRMGFVVIKNHVLVEAFTVLSQHAESVYAETEACFYAMQYDSRLDVYCDCPVVVRKFNNLGQNRIKFIERHRNTLAHTVARQKRNHKDHAYRTFPSILNRAYWNLRGVENSRNDSRKVSA